MTTRLEKQLIVKSNERERMLRRVQNATRQHKTRKDLQARAIDLTTQQLQVENRLDRRRA